MHRYKKLTAFIAALLIGASAAALPMTVASADEETTTASVTEAVSEESNAQESTSEAASESTEDSGTKVSGDFTYSINHDGLVCIDGCTFTGTDLVIPDKLDGIEVAELGKYAFGNVDKNYETITLPKTITYISSVNPFIFCPKLKEIKVASDSDSFKTADGVLCSKDMTELICYPPAKSGSSFTIPDTIKKIYTGGIYMTELSKIVFPASLEETGYAAFNSNHNIKSVDLSKTSLDQISGMAFAECTSLTDIKFPADLYSIEAGAFWGCTSLTSVDLPDSLEIIGQNAFMDTGLTEVTIPSSVREIRYCAFGYTSDANGNYTPVDSFTLIGEYGSAASVYATDTDEEYDYKNEFTFMTVNEYNAEKELRDLDKVTVEDYTYARFDDHAYIVQCTASSQEVTVPSEFDGLPVTGVYPTAFTTCTAEKIILPEGVKELREMSFYNCPYARVIVLPQSLETIGDNCFDGCAALETIDCGGAVTIGTSAFLNCVMLSSVTFSGNCTDLGDYMPFSTCTALEEINVTDGNGDFSSIDGVLFSKDGDILIEYPLNRQASTYKVPAGTVEIAVNAFSDCKTIKDVVLPKSLKTIGDYAFYGCTNLKQLRAYKNIKSIGTYAFGYMQNSAYDENDTESEKHILIDGFKLYTSKKTTAYTYAKDNDITVVTGTIRIGNKNVSIPILCVCGATILAALAAIIVSLIRKVSGKKAAPAAKKKTGGKPEKSGEKDGSKDKKADEKENGNEEE